MFSLITMNHFRAIKAWADAHGGEARLDIASFEMEVKARNRYYRLLPQFLHESDGRMLHVNTLLPKSTSFIGWRPYQALRLAMSTDKLVFKQAIAAAGLPTPAHWPSAGDATTDFILKRSVGSFGYQLAGPFRQGQLPEIPAALSDGRARGTLFAEAFTPGQIIKAWFWGAQPVHVQSQSYAAVVGDGRTDLHTLVARRLAEIGETWESYGERDQISGCLAYQGEDPGAVPAEGHPVWIDYRYGRRFTQQGNTESQDNVWPRMPDAQREQLLRAGAWLAAALRAELNAPVLCAMDGVLDASGKVWWLELNSNPVCPPTAYFEMLSSLFGTPANTPPGAFAEVVRATRTAAPTESSPAELST
jgi:hypothetical protein